MTPLRQRMIDAMVLRGFAARTQETYLSEPPRDSRRLVGVSGQLSEAGCPVS